MSSDLTGKRSKSSELRKLSILSKLSRFRKFTASQILEQLANEEIYVSIRTVQRDLQDLIEYDKFHICADESNPIGWSIDKNATLSLHYIDLTTSIAFAMADKHLTDLLPTKMKERLAPYFQTAKQYLRDESNKIVSHWPEKIMVHSKGLPLHSPTIAQDIIDAIYSATLMEKQLNLSYDSLTTGENSRFVFNPYGIVVRNERSYLIGTYDASSKVIQLAMSRIYEAEMRDRNADIEPNFTLKNFVVKGEMSVVRNDKKLDVKLWITPFLATILTETPLTKNQKITPQEDDFVITASVDDTEELRHWILSMCPHITVVSPMTLRDEIKETLTNCLSYYED